jgi:hydrogenase maturation factor
MCLAPPARVIEVAAGAALVERGGARFPVLLYLLDDEVRPGDWLAVQAQRLAVARLTEAEAGEMAATFEDIRLHLETSHA